MSMPQPLSDNLAALPSKLNILIATIDGGGNLPPLLAIANKLVRRGHHVRVLGEPSSRSDIEASGASFKSWTRAPHRLQRFREFDLIKDWAQESAQAGALHVINELICGPAQAFADDLSDELTQAPADVVLSLDMLLGVIVACESRAQKLVVLAPNLSMFPIPGLPPFGTGLPMATTDEERQLHTHIGQAVEQLFDQGLPALNAARKSYGLVPLSHVFEQASRAHAQWLLTSQAFDFPSIQLPEHVKYVGPQIDDPAWATAPSAINLAQDSRPLILVSLSSSFQNQASTLNRIIEALGTIEARVVVTLGPMLHEADVTPVSHATILRGASHEALMKRASMVITHGGHGTVIRALRHGLPLLILPHGRDQEDNAVRVTTRGAGLSLPRQATVAQINSAVSQLLSERRFSDKAAQLGAVIAKDAQQSDIVDRIEKAVMRKSFN